MSEEKGILATIGGLFTGNSDEVNDENQTLQEENTKLKAKIQSQEETIETLKREHEDVQNTLRSIQLEYQSLKETTQQMDSTNKQEEGIIAALENENEKLRKKLKNSVPLKELDQAKESKKLLQDKVNELQLNIQELQSQLSESNKMKMENDRIQKELDDINKSLEQNQLLMEKKDATISTLTNDIEELKKKVEEVEQLANETTGDTEKDSKLALAAALQKSRQEAMQLEEQLIPLKKTIATLNARLQGKEGESDANNIPIKSNNPVRSVM